MTVKLLTEHHLEFLSLKEAAQARLSLHLSKCHIVGNHMSWLNYVAYFVCVDAFCTSQQLKGHSTLPLGES